MGRGERRGQPEVLAGLLLLLLFLLLSAALLLLAFLALLVLGRRRGRERLAEVLVLLGLRQALEQRLHPDLLRRVSVIVALAAAGKELGDGRVQVQVVRAVQKSGRKQ